MKTILGVIIALLVATPATASYPVGYRTEVIQSVGGAIDVAIWYPTSSRRKIGVYETTGIAAQFTRDGRVAGGEFPLVVLSHGATASGVSYTYLSHQLASNGYIVVAPDHPDEYIAVRIDPSKVPEQTSAYRFEMLRYLVRLTGIDLNLLAAQRRPTLSYRPKQIRDVIDYATREFDISSIAVVGHSLGGWTALSAGGADPIQHDSRVGAIVALSPPVNLNMFSDDELMGVSIPTMILYGTVEVDQGRGDDKQVFFSRMDGHPMVLAGIAGADHVTFAAGGSEYRTVAGYLGDPRRAEIARCTKVFLDAYLKLDTSARTELRSLHGLNKNL